MLRAFLGEKAISVQYVAACVLAMVLGILVEIWQKFHGRTAELIDVYNDGVGIVSFAAFYAILDQRLKQNRTGWLKKRCLALFGIVVLFVGLIPFFGTINLYRNRFAILPSLLDVEQPWQKKFYYVHSGKLEVVPPPNDWPEEAIRWPKVAKLTLNQNYNYPGLVYREPHPNWVGYRAIELDVLYGEKTPREFVFRAHDYLHNDDYSDRFSRVVQVQPGYQTFRFEMEEMKQLPNGRELDFSRIGGLGFFTLKLTNEITIYVGDIRLVR